MQKNTLEYEHALDAVVEVLLTHARRGATPLTYGDLSAELAQLGHHVLAHEGPMPYLLEDASVRESSDGTRPLLSALVVLRDTHWPSGGFFKLARRSPYSRLGDNTELWTRELKNLAAFYGG
ncbi:hypothetical protein AB0C40_17375 [Streptomyces brevispora]|uniref:Uncharacterized protein n=1 Tax=Streptomyces brevispora TaxID=887462 RepID=A0ABZ1G9R3_9ACTN|nr:hypothetical protein [Streptomyces brevispora]WSC16661.1 hypothetical protein OIE64_30100 [Streptomyces brevispora]